MKVFIILIGTCLVTLACTKDTGNYRAPSYLSAVNATCGDICKK